MQAIKQQKAADTSAASFQANNPFAGSLHLQQQQQRNQTFKTNTDMSIDQQLIKNASVGPSHANTVKLIQNTRVTKIRSETNGSVQFVTNVPKITEEKSGKGEQVDSTKVVSTGSAAQDKA